MVSVFSKEEEHGANMVFVPQVIFSYNVLHVVTSSQVLYLNIIRRQIELKLKMKTEISLCMAILLDHPWQLLHAQYYPTV